MRFKVLLGTVLAWAMACKSQAIQLQDGTVYFAQPPSIVEAATTYQNTYVWGATYYFTINLPENAGEALARVTINQREGMDYVRFKLKDTYAFAGTRSQKGEKLKLKDITSDRKSRTLSLTFDPPVPPGKKITIALKPVQNPTVGGVYLFGVTAYPAGEKSHGQFLGFGRLQFYSPGINWLRWYYW